MNDLIPVIAASPLRQRLIDDMTLRKFSHETQRNHLHNVGRFATWLRRSPHTATAEDLRQFQIDQQEASVPAADYENTKTSKYRHQSSHDTIYTKFLTKRAQWQNSAQRPLTENDVVHGESAVAAAAFVVFAAQGRLEHQRLDIVRTEPVLKRSERRRRQLLCKE